MNYLLTNYLTEALRFPKELHLESSSRCNSHCLTCLDGNTNILLSNFIWKKLKDIRVDDNVVGFKYGNSYNVPLNIVSTKVISTMNREVNRLLIETDKGNIISSQSHKFVDIFHKSRYKQAKNFKVGQFIRFLGPPIETPIEDNDYMIGYIQGISWGDGCLRENSYLSYNKLDRINKYKDGKKILNYQLAMKDEEAVNRFQKYCKKFGINKINTRLRKKIKNWSQLLELRIRFKDDVYKLKSLLDEKLHSDNYKKGILAGFFDAEGCLSKRGLHFYNNNISLIEFISDILSNFKFKYKITKIHHTNIKHNDSYTIRLYANGEEKIRFFSLINPAITRKRKFLFGIHKNRAKIKKITNIGQGMVYNITTETGNYIANGFYSKNCPRDKMQRQLGELSRELFVKAVNETSEYYMDYIMLHLNGEPLFLDIDELIWRINYTRDKNPKTKQINFFTNGSLLNEEKIDKILTSKLDLIMISIDGGNKEDYEKIRRGLNWEIVINNVKYLIKRKRELNSKLIIQTAIVPQKANEKSVKDYFMLFNALGVDHVAGSGVNNIGGLIDAENMKLDTQHNDNNAINLPCFKIFLDLDIMSDGMACICSQDVIGAVQIGDLREQSLKEIWQGKIMNEIRKNFVYGRKNDITFCNKCDFMTGFVYPDYWNISQDEWIECYVEAQNRIYRIN